MQNLTDKTTPIKHQEALQEARQKITENDKNKSWVASAEMRRRMQE